jgi:hypothetical protein
MRYESCRGITVFKFGRYKLDLWFAPADYSVKEHTHPLSDGKFWVIFGHNRVIWKYRRNNLVERVSYTLKFPQCLLHVLRVRGNEPHGFEVGSTSMIWFCLQKWKRGVNVTSIIEDFVK